MHDSQRYRDSAAERLLNAQRGKNRDATAATQHSQPTRCAAATAGPDQEGMAGQINKTFKLGNEASTVRRYRQSNRKSLGEGTCL